MLRKRSRATNSKQVLMADYGSLPSLSEKYGSATPSFLSSPWLFTAFPSKGFAETESLISPTSILDSRAFSASKNPFGSDISSPKGPKPGNRNVLYKLDSGKVGLGLINALNDNKSQPQLSKPETPAILFGSQLNIQIPPLLPSVLSPADSPNIPKDFGIKTRNSQLGSFSPRLSPSLGSRSPFGTANSGPESSNSPLVFDRCLSASEMDSEDYTCVISYGPNPRTTHIFYDCVVESYSGVVRSSTSRTEDGFLANGSVSYPFESFLSICYRCKKNLGQGKDIYMYRGEKAFCSSECRCEEILLESKTEKLESDDVYGTCS